MNNWIVFKFIDNDGEELIGIQREDDWTYYEDEILSKNLTKYEAEKQMKQFSNQYNIGILSYKDEDKDSYIVDAVINSEFNK